GVTRIHLQAGVVFARGFFMLSDGGVRSGELKARPRCGSLHYRDATLEVRSAGQRHSHIPIVRLRKIERQRPMIRAWLWLGRHSRNRCWWPPLNEVIGHDDMNDVVRHALRHMTAGTVFTVRRSRRVTVHTGFVEMCCCISTGLVWIVARHASHGRLLK